MKKLILILSLLLSTIMFSSLSFGEWELVATNTYETELYVDFDKIRVRGGFCLLDRTAEPTQTTLWVPVGDSLYGERLSKTFLYNSEFLILCASDG